jgi:hypothetical protein
MKIKIKIKSKILPSPPFTKEGAKAPPLEKGTSSCEAALLMGGIFLLTLKLNQRPPL